MAIKLWSLEKYAVQKTLLGHEHEVSGLAFVPSHPDFLVSCSRDQSLRVWDTVSGACLHTLMQHTDWVKRVAVASTLIASASNDESILIWSTERVLAGAEPSQALHATLSGHDNQIDCIAFAPLDSARSIEMAEYSGGTHRAQQ
jgi:platelet-activating factor acetylhydrolase IB subunit alpha